jgi:hypothetical protein
MPLYHTPPQPNSDAEQLATEARKRLTELADTTFWAYGQLENYEKNNSQKVTPTGFRIALGKDHKDFVAIKRAMKRLLIKINPEFKDKLTALEKELAPKKRK